MQQEEYITVTEYSKKYNVSVNTIHSRIRRKQIEFKKISVIYLIKDEPYGKKTL